MGVVDNEPVKFYSYGFLTTCCGHYTTKPRARRSQIKVLFCNASYSSNVLANESTDPSKLTDISFYDQVRFALGFDPSHRDMIVAPIQHIIRSLKGLRGLKWDHFFMRQSRLLSRCSSSLYCFGYTCVTASVIIAYLRHLL